jgi:hypothetical protein
MIRGMRRMFVVDESMAVPGGYTPCVVIEGDGVYYSMGGHSNVRPWVWGPTLELAQGKAREMNAESGLSETDESEILASVATESRGTFVRDGEAAVTRLTGRPTCLMGCTNGQHVELCDYYLSEED